MFRERVPVVYSVWKVWLQVIVTSASWFDVTLYMIQSTRWTAWWGRLSGTSPVEMDLLKMRAREDAISSAVSLSSLPGIPSGPVALLGWRSFRSFATPSGMMVKPGIAGYDVTSGSSILEMDSSSVKTDSNCLFRMLALVVLSEESFSFSLRLWMPQVSFFNRFINPRTASVTQGRCYRHNSNKPFWCLSGLPFWQI